MKQKSAYTVAVVGATGAVGAEMIAILAERKFPVGVLQPLASYRSAGGLVTFHDQELVVRELTKDSFEGVDIALFSAGADISREFAPIAAKAGAVVIDNSSAWRMGKDVPLVVPEVNPADIAKHKGSIANPNCSTVQMVSALKLLNETRKIMGDDSIRVTATTVRVPVYVGHSESVNIETEKKLTANEARAILSEAPGVLLYDDPVHKVYPMPIDVAGKDEVFVGRIREDESIPNGLNLWIVADNLRKGAALNAIQIAEELIAAAR